MPLPPGIPCYGCLAELYKKKKDKVYLQASVNGNDTIMSIEEGHLPMLTGKSFDGAQRGTTDGERISGLGCWAVTDNAFNGLLMHCYLPMRPA